MIYRFDDMFFFDWVFFANENSPLLQNGCWKICQQFTAL